MEYIFLSALSFILSSVSTPIVIFLSNKLHIVDIPNNRKIHVTPTPRVGGISLILGVFLTLLIIKNNQTSFFYPCLIANGIIIFTGLLDDIKNISAWWKLTGQIIATCVVIFVCGVKFKFGGTTLSFMNINSLSIILTFLWVIGVTNAVNLIDGMDGLAGGIAFFAFGTIFVTAVTKNFEIASYFSIIMLGATLGFLKYNFPKAKIFMGDVGSLFLGFNISILSLMVSSKTGTLISVLFPALFILIPIFDTFMAIIRRIRKGKNPLTNPDKEHLHHKLLLLKFSNKQSLVLFYFVAGILSYITIVTHEKSLLVGFSISLTILYLLLFTLSIMRKNKFEEKIEHISKIISEFDNKIIKLAQKKKTQDVIIVKILMGISLGLTIFAFFPITNYTYSHFLIISISVITYIISLAAVKFYKINGYFIGFTTFWLHFYIIHILINSGYNLFLSLVIFGALIPLIFYKLLVKNQYNVFIIEPTELLIVFTLILLFTVNPNLSSLAHKSFYAFVFYYTNKIIYRNNIEVSKDYYFAKTLILFILPFSLYFSYVNTPPNRPEKNKKIEYIKKYTISHDVKETYTLIKKDPLLLYNPFFTQKLISSFKSHAENLKAQNKTIQLKEFKQSVENYFPKLKDNIFSNIDL